MNMGYHFELIRDAMNMLADVFGGTKQFSDDAIAIALLSNGFNDIFQEDKTEIGINDVFCRLAKPVVDCNHYDQLYSANLIHSYSQKLLLNTFDIIKQACEENSQQTAMFVVGMSLHIVCDFYAHSNWVELEMPRHLKDVQGNPIKDATYYDMLLLGQRGEDALSEAIRANKSHSLLRFEGEKRARRYGLYSHGNRDGTVPTPDHDHLHKDYAGRPHFDWAYRAAFKASVQHLLLIREYLTSLNGGTSFWNSFSNYSLPKDIAGDVRTAVSFEEGTIRWMTIYGGAWKHGTRWGSEIEILADNLNNAKGIGILDQYELPILGVEWLSTAISFSDGLFEAYDYFSPDSGIESFSREAYFETLKEFSDYGEEATQIQLDFLYNYLLPKIVSVEEWKSPLAEALKEGAYNRWHETERPVYGNNLIISKAFLAFQSTQWKTFEQALHWIRIQIPFAKDLDTGTGALNLNNEEWGGDSDYWVKFYVNGTIYTEAEYVDNPHPHTNWQVLRPCISPGLVDVQIKMYESDLWNHTSARMDISPGKGMRLEFRIHSGTGQIYCDIDGVEIINCPSGHYLRSSGSGDFRARVDVVVGIMSDNRVELVAKARRNEKRVTDFPDSMALTGGYGWSLKRAQIQKKTHYDHFTFDPGKHFKPEHLSGLRLVFPKSATPDKVEHIAARFEELEQYSFSLSGSYSQVGESGEEFRVRNSADLWITSAQCDENLDTLSVITYTNKGTESPVYISLYDAKNVRIGHYRLTTFEKTPFQPGQADFFWIGEQRLADGFASQPYSGKINRIKRVEVSTESGGELVLDKIEIFANGYMIGREQWRSISHTNSLDVEIILPTNIYWKELPEVTFLGIKEKDDDKMLGYRVEGHLIFEGYSETPNIRLVITPDSGALTSTSYSVNSKEFILLSNVFINRHRNYEFNYQWKVSVTDVSDGSILQETASFEIPHPYVEIFEKSFTGGDELIEVNEEPRLRFTGSYDFQCHNFGIENPDWFRPQIWIGPQQARGGTERDLDEIKFDRPYDSQEPWPYLEKYNLQLMVKDIYDICLEETSMVVAIPTLAAEHIVQYRGKKCSYFDTGKDILRVTIDDERHATFAQQYQEVRAEYAFADLTIVPFLERDGDFYSFQVFQPKFEWYVPGPDCGVLAKTSGTLGKNLKVPTAPEFLKGVSVKYKDTLKDLIPIADQLVGGDETNESLEGPSIWVSLGYDLGNRQLPLSENGVPIYCTITDAVKQQYNYDFNLKGYTGLSLATINDIRALYTAKQTIVKYAEHVSIMDILANNFWTIDLSDIENLPALDMDPLDPEILTAPEKGLFERYNELTRLYRQNGRESVNQNSTLQLQATQLLDATSANFLELETLDNSIPSRVSGIGDVLVNTSISAQQIKNTRLQPRIVMPKKIWEGRKEK